MKPLDPVDHFADARFAISRLSAARIASGNRVDALHVQSVYFGAASNPKPCVDVPPRRTPSTSTARRQV